MSEDPYDYDSIQRPVVQTYKALPSEEMNALRARVAELEGETLANMRLEARVEDLEKQLGDVTLQRDDHHLTLLRQEARVAELEAENAAHKHLAGLLREYTAMKYMGDCKCGRCQLVPREVLDRIIKGRRDER